jgi:hypothetical protein
MVLELKFLKMVTNIRVNIKMENLMAKENINGLMETVMKVNLSWD